MGYDWSFTFLLPYTNAFLRAIWITLEISLGSFFLGTILGIPIGIILHAFPFRRVLLLINDAIRAVPILVLIFFVYYFPFKQMLGINNASAVLSAIIAISISQIAYTADLVRSAIDGIPPRLFIGGRALGLTNISIWRYLVLPDILRQVLPAEIAFLIGIIRLSSLAAVIGAPEIVFVARISSSQNFRSLEAWILVAILYIALVLPVTVASRYLEKSQWLKRRW